MDDLIVLTFYGVCLFAVLVATKHSGGLKYLTLFLALFLFKSFVAKAVYDNSLQSISDIRLYSLYDSASYYSDTLNMLDTAGGVFPELPANAADPGYNTFLYWIGSLYRDILGIDRLEYLLFLYSNAFVGTLLFVAIREFLGESHLLTSNAISATILLLALTEPTLLAFGSTLEREVLLGLLALVTFVSFMNNRTGLFVAGSIVLLLFRNTYGYVIPAILLAWLAYRFVPWFRTHFLLYVCTLVLFFGVSVQLVTSVSRDFGEFLFRHIASDTDLSGFGGFIQGLPSGLSAPAFGVLGFLSPIPAYPLFDARIQGFFLFGALVGVGSVLYLSYNLIVIAAVVRLRSMVYGVDPIEPSIRARVHSELLVVMKGFIVVFVSQLAFQGFAYNVRHKVQTIPFLIFLSLYCLRFLKVQPGMFAFLRLRPVVRGIYVMIGLNLVYLAARIALNRIP
jgi:hypothetical protein